MDAELTGDQLKVTIEGRQQTACVFQSEGNISIFSSETAFDIETKPMFALEDATDNLDAGFVAPMNGTIIDILASPGQTVASGTTLLIMEAMKMEHAMQAPVDGLVGEIFYKIGDLVEGGATLLDFEASDYH